MPAPTSIEELLRQGRTRSWWPFLLALAVLVAVTGYGVAIYDRLPDRIPLHFGPGGEPTRWGEKSPGTVFMGPMLGAATLLVLPVAAAVLPSLTPTPGDASDWRRLQVEGSRRGTRAGLGWVALLLSALFAWISVTTWQAPARLSAWPVAVFLALTFLTLWLAYRRWERWARRIAEVHGIHPTPEEEAEERLWLPLGLYHNPDDPRAFPPKREGYGVGTTINVGSRGGRIALLLFAAVIVVPIVLILWLG